jgi:peptidoglycan/LPS O-acetylase OafA/YrhL
MGSLERQGDSANWVQIFYLRRAFRIYPLSIAAVLFVIALRDPAAGHPAPHGVAVTLPPLDATTIASNLALVQNVVARRNILGPLWTLPVELQMYLFLPLCFVLARRSAWHVVGLFVASIAAYEIVAHPPFPELQRLGVFVYGPCFLGGVLAYHLSRRAASPRVPSWTLLLVLAAGYAWLLLATAQPHRPLTWITPIGVGALLPFIRQPRESWLSKLAHTICTYSYGWGRRLVKGPAGEVAFAPAP